MVRAMTQNVGVSYFRPAGVSAPGRTGSAHTDEDAPAPVVKAAPAPPAVLTTKMMRQQQQVHR
jgi:hypothetical protein